MFVNEAFLLILPLAYAVLIFSASCLSIFQKKPHKLYHSCKASSVRNIFKDKKFITKTEGRAFFSPKKDNSLGLAQEPLKSLIRLVVNTKIWITNKTTKNKQMLIPKQNIATANVIFQKEALEVLNPIFNIHNIYHLFNIWAAIKLLRKEWVTLPLHDVILTKCYFDNEGNCVVENAKLEKKKGNDYLFCLCKVIGMILLNIHLSFCFISMAIAYFYPDWGCTLIFSVSLLPIFILVIFVWFVINQLQIK